MDTSINTQPTARSLGRIAKLFLMLSLIAVVGVLAIALFISVPQAANAPGNLQDTAAADANSGVQAQPQTVPADENKDPWVVNSRLCPECQATLDKANVQFEDPWLVKFRFQQAAKANNVQDAWLVKFRLGQAAGAQTVQDAWVTKFRLGQTANANAFNEPERSDCSKFLTADEQARCLGVR